MRTDKIGLVTRENKLLSFFACKCGAAGSISRARCFSIKIISYILGGVYERRRVKNGGGVATIPVINIGIDVYGQVFLIGLFNH